MTLTLNPQAERYLHALQTLTPYEQSIVVQTLEQIATTPDPAAEALSAEISGRHFNPQERIQLEMDTLARHFLHRRQLLENAFTAPQVAKILGTSRQTPHDRANSQTLLAIKDNGKLLFPAWQFDPTGPDGVVDGLPQVLKALALSDYAKLNWLTRPNPYLEGLTPVEALKQGKCDHVIQEAQAVGASQWS
jgi:hypothetical protein